MIQIFRKSVKGMAEAVTVNLNELGFSLPECRYELVRCEC